MDYEPKLRRNGQVVQPNIEYTPEGNGWPEPLTDESNPIRHTVTAGRNGESIANDGKGKECGTGGRPEGGSYQDLGGTGSLTDELKTSQQKSGEHDTAEG
jgi:hypothetical protein